MLAEANAHGALTRFEAHGLSLLLNPATSIEAGPANVHLRVLGHEAGEDPMRRTPLLGQASPSRVAVVDDTLRATGRWHGLDYAALAGPGPRGRRRGRGTSRSSTPRDAARADRRRPHPRPGARPGRVPCATNQYYVSQYLDLTPVDTSDHGVALAVRQNMPGKRVPWVVVGSLGRGVRLGHRRAPAGRADRGRAVWSGLDRPDLPSTRLQHEHALAAVQDDAGRRSRPGRRHRTGFFGLVLPDHPAATGPDDVRHVETACPRGAAGTGPARMPAPRTHEPT